MERARRAILAVIPGVVSMLVAAAVPAQQVPAAGPPRKVVVGSLMYSMWGPLSGRCQAPGGLVVVYRRNEQGGPAEIPCRPGHCRLARNCRHGRVRGSAKDTALPLEARSWTRWAPPPGGIRPTLWCRCTWLKTRPRPGSTTPVCSWIATAKWPASTARSIPWIPARQINWKAAFDPARTFQSWLATSARWACRFAMTCTSTPAGNRWPTRAAVGDLAHAVAADYRRAVPTRVPWGFMYRPTISINFSTNCGSLETLNVFTQCGFSPWAAHTRCTASLLTPTTLAIVRVLQCVAASGFSCVVLLTIRSTISVVKVRFRPGRVASFSIPAIRRLAKRLRQRPTVGFDVPIPPRIVCR